ncbi:putative serine/threonine-protein kinase-like protein CCR3 [Hibiscus syriacus]|uniref:Serine/threonine-protein kinase-like protein CCR3 n=1 Tax=Hibiscus syriacus TaxID=106335 RepID=A0A6A2YZA6_HIBSY|nr:putative serine/threonine-protein kinase-like protein CCR3 [Hibiscus syriacus]
MKRQISGTSSKHADGAEEFSLVELAAATNDFSPENKMGAGSFGIVYKGKLWDGREVAIKRGETGQKTRNSKRKRRHLNQNWYFCQGFIISIWKMRTRIALDAARGIEYLHNYADPESNRDYRLMKAAGTVGYIDPEHYGLNVLTTKSDVYGLGVVMLELLTGKRAIFKNDESGGTPITLVDFAVPAIIAGEMVKVLGPRVGPPELNEAEAVELMAYTAMHCVNLEGKERPIIGDIVSNLERALNVCDGSHGSISSGAFSLVSD